MVKHTMLPAALALLGLFSFSARANEPPKITGPLDAGGFAGEPFDWDYSFYVSDPDGDKITARSSDSRHVTWKGLVATFRFDKPGEHRIRITFTDSHGSKVSHAANVRLVRRKRWKDFISAIHGSALYTSEGRVDVERTIAALKKIGANAFVLPLAYDKQWEDIMSFLPEADRQRIKVFLLGPDARHGVGPCGCGKEWWWNLPKPYCKDYVKWMEVLGRLALEHPALEGIFIDDFEAGAFSKTGGFTVPYIRQIMQAKNRVNPNFKFMPGIYIPRGLCDIEVKQKGGSVRHMKRIVFSAEYTCAKPPKEAYVQLITQAHPNEHRTQSLTVNDVVLYADILRREPRMVRVGIRTLDPKQWRIKYELLHRGFVTYLSCHAAPWLVVDGNRVPLEWKVEKDDERYAYSRYAASTLKPYYDLTDGVVLYTNSFDLIKPENDIFQELMKVARERIGKRKLIFGHFYGAEPWKEPVFPSEYYYDTFARLTTVGTDGVYPWFALLLPYYAGYSSGIYSQPKNDKPEYDFRFRYPSYTSYEVGFYQGISAEIRVPGRVSNAAISFRIEDNRDRNAGRWVKELVLRSGRFSHEAIGEKELAKADRLWFTEEGTVWHDMLEGDEGKQEVSVPSRVLKPLLTPGRKVTLVLRMRADRFRGAGSAPPEINVYVTRPRVMINGREIRADWKYESGNALEPLWLRSSEKVVQILRGVRDRK